MRCARSSCWRSSNSASAAASIPASLSRIIPKLAADGIVSRYHNLTDQRRVVVSLTPRGRDMVEDAIADGAQVYEQLAREVGAERLENACRVLEELIAHLAAPAGESGAAEA